MKPNTLASGHWFYDAKCVLFSKISKPISQSTKPILGMFVLIWLHFSWWFQIWSINSRRLTFFEKLCPVVCTPATWEVLRYLMRKWCMICRTQEREDDDHHRGWEGGEIGGVNKEGIKRMRGYNVIKALERWLSCYKRCPVQNWGENYNYIFISWQWRKHADTACKCLHTHVLLGVRDFT